MPKLRARYVTKGPKKEMVTYKKCHIDKNGALQMEDTTEEMECYYVMFPQGHSIRVTSFDRLKEMGYHLKPRIVDMETGDVIDRGGDPYDFSGDFTDDVIPMEDEEEPRPVRSKTGQKEPA